MPPDADAPIDGAHDETLLTAEPLVALGANLLEVAPTVAQSALGQTVGLESRGARPTTDADMEEAFGGLRHFAIEIRVAVGDADAYLVTLLLPATGLAGLFGIELDEDSLDEESAAPALEQAGTAASELLDLLTLMLFADTAVRAELKLSEVRLDELDMTLGMITDTAGGAPIFRLDHEITVADAETPFTATLLVPQTLLQRIQADLSGDGAPAAAAADDAVSEPAGLDEPDLADAGALPPLAADGDLGVDAFGQGGPRLGEIDDATLQAAGDSVPIQPIRFPDLRPGMTGGMAQALDLILDVSMRVSVELGRTKLTVQEILALGTGSVVELDKLAGEPVDILINERLIARGEVVMVEENFGVRVTEILRPGPTAQVVDTPA